MQFIQDDNGVVIPVQDDDPRVVVRPEPGSLADIRAQMAANEEYGGGTYTNQDGGSNKWSIVNGKIYKFDPSAQISSEVLQAYPMASAHEMWQLTSPDAPGNNNGNSSPFTDPDFWSGLAFVGGGAALTGGLGGLAGGGADLSSVGGAGGLNDVLGTGGFNPGSTGALGTVASGEVGATTGALTDASWGVNPQGGGGMDFNLDDFMQSIDNGQFSGGSGDFFDPTAGNSGALDLSNIPDDLGNDWTPGKPLTPTTDPRQWLKYPANLEALKGVTSLGVSPAQALKMLTSGALTGTDGAVKPGFVDSLKKLLGGDMSGLDGVLGGATTGAMTIGALNALFGKQEPNPLAGQATEASNLSLSAAKDYAGASAPALSGNQQAAIDYAKNNAGAGADLITNGSKPVTADQISALLDPKLESSKRFLDTGYDLLTDGAKGPTEDEVNAYLNPRNRSVVDQALADLARRQAQEKNATQGDAARAGAFGGSRALMLEKTQQDAQDRAYGATSGALNKDAYDAALASAFKVKEGERASGGVLTGTGTNLAGIEQNAWTGAGNQATYNQRDLIAAGGALTDNYAKTTDALTKTGALEQSPAVVDFTRKAALPALYSNVASNAATTGARIMPPNRFALAAGALGALNKSSLGTL